MPNPIYQQMGGGSMPGNPMLQKFLQFKKTFSGNPQQMVQNMLNSGKISQSQLNQYAQKANQLYEQLKPFM